MIFVTIEACCSQCSRCERIRGAPRSFPVEEAKGRGWSEMNGMLLCPVCTKKQERSVKHGEPRTNKEKR